jgi:hypothetical protein
MTVSMKRREFLVKSAILASAASLLPDVRATWGVAKRAPDFAESPQITFETSDPQHQQVYSHALEVLARNTTEIADFPAPVLIEGSNYSGIWLECAPQEGLVYSVIRPDVARSNHLAFFALQHEDGQLPCWSRKTATGFGQIQMVVPIAATAWELSQKTGDHELLEKAYESCSRWDAWLRRYRDTRRTGLCEGFCTWDTGHDNSPRWAGIPNRCPDGDARKCPPVPSLPRLCPDLSATVYGGRMALSEMAHALGKNSESDRWLADAEAIRKAIITRLYSEEDASFYDLDAQNHFVRVRGDVISRVLGEHVVDRKMFDTIYLRQIHDSQAFWAPYPLPSIALDDPAFVRPIPRNSWGGASQALTALRAPRWMEHYGKPADLAHLMSQWVKAILRAGNFLQQMDPLNGSFTPAVGDYSPAALALMDFTWRLSGVRTAGDFLEWNVRPPAQGIHSSYKLRTSASIAELKYTSRPAELSVNGKVICQVRGIVRLTTNQDGKITKATGIAEKAQTIILRQNSQKERKFTIEANQQISLIPV